MEIIPLLQKEFNEETQITKKMLERVPEDKWDWQPHAKSMTIKQLTVHLAETTGWPAMMLQTDGLDFATMPYEPSPVNTTADLVALLDTEVQKTQDGFNGAKEENLTATWTLSSGDQVFAKMTKYEAIRHAFAQQTHHRAQLGVYLRLLNIPIPGSYGPSADEMTS